MTNPLELAVAVTYSGIDGLSNKLSSIGQGLMDFGNRAQEAGEKLGGLGERMVGFGERLGLTAALASEGAAKLHDWSEALAKPAQDMQKNMATVAAMTGLGGDALEKIKQHAVKFSAVHSGVVAEEWIAGFARMRGIFHDTTQAMRSEDVAAMLKRLGVDSDSATRLIATGWSNLGIQAVKTGDQFTHTIQLFDLAPGQTNQFAMAVGPLGASAAAEHAPFSEVLALGSEDQQLLNGGRGATTFASIIQGLETATANGKATVDFSRGLIAALQQLRLQLNATPADKIAALAQMGLSSQAPQLLKLLDNLDQVAAKQKQIGEASGALAKAYGTATNNMVDATTRLNQNWSNLANALTSPALGIQARATNLLSDSIEGLTKHLEDHSVIAGAATVAITGLGSAAYHSVQALSALGTISIFAGQGLKDAQWSIKALDFEGLALRGMYLWERMGQLVNITRIWTDAQWLLNAALAAKPIVLAVAGAVAFAAAAYEVYKHWSAVCAFFEHLWSRIKIPFRDGVDWLKTAGINMMKSLGEGIPAGIEYPFKAASQVAEKVGRLFHFHSPPDEGPLRAAVLNFRFGEELAKHIKPAPIIGSARELAAGIAGAAPRGAAGSGGITINYSPQVIIQGSGSAKDELVKALRQHADEVVRIVRQKLAREARLSFT